MKKIVTTTLFIVSFVLSISAQNTSTFYYSMGLGLGDLGEYISSPSFRGIGFNHSMPFTEKISLGVSISWNAFYEEKSRDTYEFGNSAMHGKQFRYANQIPLFIRAEYQLKPNSNFNPFGGINIGTMHTRRDTEMGLFTLKEVGWGFAIAPEVGFYKKVTDDNDLFLSLKYNLGFKSGNSFEELQSYLALNIGLTI